MLTASPKKIKKKCTFKLESPSTDDVSDELENFKREILALLNNYPSRSHHHHHHHHRHQYDHGQENERSREIDQMSSTLARSSAPEVKSIWFPSREPSKPSTLMPLPSTNGKQSLLHSFSPISAESASMSASDSPSGSGQLVNSMLALKSAAFQDLASFKNNNKYSSNSDFSTESLKRAAATNNYQVNIESFQFNRLSSDSDLGNDAASEQMLPKPMIKTKKKRAKLGRVQLLQAETASISSQESSSEIYPVPIKKSTQKPLVPILKSTKPSIRANDKSEIVPERQRKVEDIIRMFDGPKAPIIAAKVTPKAIADSLQEKKLIESANKSLHSSFRSRSLMASRDRDNLLLKTRSRTPLLSDIAHSKNPSASKSSLSRKSPSPLAFHKSKSILKHPSTAFMKPISINVVSMVQTTQNHQNESSRRSSSRSRQSRVGFETPVPAIQKPIPVNIAPVSTYNYQITAMPVTSPPKLEPKKSKSILKTGFQSIQSNGLQSLKSASRVGFKTIEPLKESSKIEWNLPTKSKPTKSITESSSKALASTSKSKVGFSSPTPRSKSVMPVSSPKTTNSETQTPKRSKTPTANMEKFLVPTFQSDSLPSFNSQNTPNTSTPIENYSSGYNGGAGFPPIATIKIQSNNSPETSSFVTNSNQKFQYTILQAPTITLKSIPPAAPKKAVKSDQAKPHVSTLTIKAFADSPGISIKPGSIQIQARSSNNTDNSFQTYQQAQGSKQLPQFIDIPVKRSTTPQYQFVTPLYQPSNEASSKATSTALSSTSINNQQIYQYIPAPTPKTSAQFQVIKAPVTQKIYTVPKQEPLKTPQIIEIKNEPLVTPRKSRKSAPALTIYQGPVVSQSDSHAASYGVSMADISPIIKTQPTMTAKQVTFKLNTETIPNRTSSALSKPTSSIRSVSMAPTMSMASQSSRILVSPIRRLASKTTVEPSRLIMSSADLGFASNFGRSRSVAVPNHTRSMVATSTVAPFRSSSQAPTFSVKQPQVVPPTPKQRLLTKPTVKTAPKVQSVPPKPMERTSRYQQSLGGTKATASSIGFSRPTMSSYFPAAATKQAPSMTGHSTHASPFGSYTRTIAEQSPTMTYRSDRSFGRSFSTAPTMTHTEIASARSTRQPSLERAPTSKQSIPMKVARPVSNTRVVPFSAPTQTSHTKNPIMPVVPTAIRPVAARAPSLQPASSPSMHPGYSCNFGSATGTSFTPYSSCALPSSYGNPAAASYNYAQPKFSQSNPFGFYGYRGW